MNANVAAVQAAPVFMDREATLDKTELLVKEAAADGVNLVVFPEVFIPGTPLWMDSQPIWEGDDEWYALLVDQSVVVPGPTTGRLAGFARDSEVYMVIGINEREVNGGTLYNTVLYFGPDGTLLGKHRKLVPTGSERTIWGMGDGSTLQTYETPFGKVGGLTCWENYMPLARFYMYSQGVDVWLAPTLAKGDNWIASMRHIAREGRCYVVGVNPCLHIDQIPADFPHRDSLWVIDEEREETKWLEPGNSVIVSPMGEILAGPSRHEETILYAGLDLAEVHAARRMFDPVGHYHRPDVFRLGVDTRPRPPVVELGSILDDAGP
ncbi:MAG TPA: carbon-nitrogen hydrolase family protein [Actinomycetota bacterium]|nr:carbon-nitrogen hydrolase family protein [Actinomycetota bacterium]